MSTGWPRSSASSCVSSIGKPYVAASVNASSASIAGRAGEVVEHALPARERLGEPFLFAAPDALDLVGVLREQRVRLAHLPDDDARQPVRVVQSDAARLVDRAPQEAAADVAAPFVRRLDPFGDQEARCAAVVGEHAMRAQRDVALAVRHTRLRFDPVHDLPKAVRVEHRARRPGGRTPCARARCPCRRSASAGRRARCRAAGRTP